MNTDATLGELQTLLGRLLDKATDIGLELTGAILILVVGWWLARRAQGVTHRLLDGIPGLDATVKPFLGSLVRYTVLLITLVAVLAQFGVQTTSIIAVLGAAGLAIGLALQGTLQNVAAGVMLLLLRPFQIGDYIDAEGTAGTVEATGLFITELTTFDGVYRSVPNAQLWGRAILNYSRNPTRRLDVPVGIAYGDDIGQAFGVLLPLMQGDERVRTEPPPHKVYGPEQNDLNLQLRKAGIDKIILAGMSANLCVQAHLHELLEQGYEVAVVRDATAAARLPEGDGYLAAIINFRYIANALWTTEEAVARIKAAA